jgi:hypothetical protein
MNGAAAKTAAEARNRRRVGKPRGMDFIQAMDDGAEKKMWDQRN